MSTHFIISLKTVILSGLAILCIVLGFLAYEVARRK